MRTKHNKVNSSSNVEVATLVLAFLFILETIYQIFRVDMLPCCEHPKCLCAIWIHVHITPPPPSPPPPQRNLSQPFFLHFPTTTLLLCFRPLQHTCTCLPRGYSHWDQLSASTCQCGLKLHGHLLLATHSVHCVSIGFTSTQFTSDLYWSTLTVRSRWGQGNKR